MVDFTHGDPDLDVVSIEYTAEREVVKLMKSQQRLIDELRDENKDLRETVDSMQLGQIQSIDGCLKELFLHVTEQGMRLEKMLSLQEKIFSIQETHLEALKLLVRQAMN
jgi:hypothetical protein